MGEMTSKERVLAACRQQPVDYVPCAPFMNSQDWPQRMGMRWQYPFGPSTPEVLKHVVGEMGLDQIVEFSWGPHPEPEVSSRVWTEGDVIHKRISTPSGDLHSAVRLTDAWPHGFDVPFFSDYNSAHCVEPWIENHADVACLRHVLLPPGSEEHLAPIRFGYEQTRQLADAYDIAVCFHGGLGLTGALQMFGPTELCMLALTDPDLVDAYLDVDHAYNLRNYEIAMDLGVDLVRRNGFYETCSFYSPDMLDRFLRERINEEIRIVHEADRVIGYTMHSGYMPMLDHLAALDFDFLFCTDVFMQDADPVLLNQAIGDRKAFWTGPSDTIHLPYDRPDEVRQAVRTVFEVFGKEGLVISPTSSSKAVFPWGNVLAMVDEWKRLR
jgi:hypothetical protein